MKQHLLPDVLIHLPLIGKVRVVRLRMHTHTHIQTQALQVSISTLSQHLLQQLVGVIDHRCVRPVGVVEGEVLDAVFWLLGVGDTCREETAVTGFR